CSKTGSSPIEHLFSVQGIVRLALDVQRIDLGRLQDDVVRAGWARVVRFVDEANPVFAQRGRVIEIDVHEVQASGEAAQNVADRDVATPAIFRVLLGYRQQAFPHGHLGGGGPVRYEVVIRFA